MSILHQVTLQQNAPIEVFSHCKIISFDVKCRGTIDIKVKTTCNSVMTFVMIGKDNCRKLLTKFRKGDSVNIVSEGGVLRKFAKGINVEV